MQNYSDYTRNTPLNHENERVQYLKISSFSDISALLKFNQHQISNQTIYMFGFEEKKNPPMGEWSNYENLPLWPPKRKILLVSRFKIFLTS